MEKRNKHRLWHRAMPAGLSYVGGVHDATNVAFLADRTWVDTDGNRHSDQEIFDSAFEMIRKARKFLLVDMFLYNDFQGKTPETTRLLSGELTDILLCQKAAYPDMIITVITDPINTVYGSLPSAQFDGLASAGIDVVTTNLTRLRDSNPIYSLFWRLFIKPFGNSKRGSLQSPFGGKGQVTLRSFLALLNFKANHRKVIIADDGDELVALVTSANPHDASSAHTNVGVRFTGQAAAELLFTENAVLAFSGRKPLQFAIDPPAQATGVSVQVLTERAIKTAALDVIEQAMDGERIDLATFYLSDRDVINALKQARRNGVLLRVLLDPNKDAFGHSKNGIPNRSVAAELRRAGIDVRWSHTHGEQCHAKMLKMENKLGEGVILLGSANLTRRNLDDFNLETNVLIRAAASSGIFEDAQCNFDLLWSNQPGQVFSVSYDHYRDESPVKKCLYRFMEASGLSTF